MKKTISCEDVLTEISSNPILSNLINNEIQCPTFFCFNKRKVKAFVLGADPSNFSNNKIPKRLKTVFGIGGSDKRYFQIILENLKQIGLSLEDIYVENIIRCYLREETSKNNRWEQIADYWLPLLKDDFNRIDISGKVPVLLTTEVLYKYLIEDKTKCKSAEELYLLKGEIPVLAEDNKLYRPLIPFYRHRKYKLNDDANKNYRELVCSIFSS